MCVILQGRNFVRFSEEHQLSKVFFLFLSWNTWLFFFFFLLSTDKFYEYKCPHHGATDSEFKEIERSKEDKKWWPRSTNLFGIFVSVIFHQLQMLMVQEEASCVVKNKITVYGLLPTGRMFDVSATSRWGMHGLIENELSATPCSATFTAALYNGP